MERKKLTSVELAIKWGAVLNQDVSKEFDVSNIIEPFTSKDRIKNGKRTLDEN